MQLLLTVSAHLQGNECFYSFTDWVMYDFGSLKNMIKITVCRSELMATRRDCHTIRFLRLLSNELRHSCRTMRRKMRSACQEGFLALRAMRSRSLRLPKPRKPSGVQVTLQKEVIKHRYVQLGSFPASSSKKNYATVTQMIHMANNV